MKLWMRHEYLTDPHDAPPRQPPALPLPTIVEVPDLWAEGRADLGEAAQVLEEAEIRAHHDFGDVYLLVTSSPGRLLQWLDKADHRALLAAAPNAIVALRVTNQVELDAGAPLLALVPTPNLLAVVVEPVAPIDLRHGKNGPGGRWGAGVLREVTVRPSTILADWVVVRAPSGPAAPPLHPGWVKSLRDQAAAATVPFAFLGWGRWKVVDGLPRHGDVWALGGGHTQPWARETQGAPAGKWAVDEDVIMRPMGELPTGCLLDGGEYLDGPEMCR